MKKGQYTLGHKWLYYAIAIFLITVMLLFFRAKIQNDIIMETACLEEVEYELIMTEALFSQNCFAYYDEDLQRTIEGSIDFDKFNEETFNDCFKFLEQDVQITIYNRVLGDPASRNLTTEKLVKVYSYDNVELTVAKFTFEESLC
jgi:hypothetical protein